MTSQAETRIVFVRHGEAVCNVDGRVGGLATCRGLTAQGRREVGALCARLVRTRELTAATVLVSSPLPRALETAAQLSASLGLEVTVDADVREVDGGDADGEPVSSWLERYGAAPLTACAPGAESLAAFLLRVATAIDRLTQRHAGRTVVVSTHAGFIDATMATLLRTPWLGPRLFELATAPASITEWCRQDDRWCLVRYNDASHLIAGLG